jgi:hypothetical protein
VHSQWIGLQFMRFDGIYRKSPSTRPLTGTWSAPVHAQARGKPTAQVPVVKSAGEQATTRGRWTQLRRGRSGMCRGSGRVTGIWERMLGWFPRHRSLLKKGIIRIVNVKEGGTSIRPQNSARNKIPQKEEGRHGGRHRWRTLGRSPRCS